MGKPAAVHQNHLYGGSDRAAKWVVAAGVSNNVAFALILLCGEMEPNVRDHVQRRRHGAGLDTVHRVKEKQNKCNRNRFDPSQGRVPFFEEFI